MLLVAVAVDAAYAAAAAADDVAEAPRMMMVVVDDDDTDDTPMGMDERTPECHDAMVPWSIGPAGRDRLA